MIPTPQLFALAARPAVCNSHELFWTCLKRHDQHTTVWSVASGAATAVIKQHRGPRAFAQELHAYRSWLPRLDGDDARTPTLLAVDDNSRALALSHAPGQHLSSGTFSESAVHAAHLAAGGFIRALHELPVEDDDPVALAEAIGTRLAEAHARAHDLLGPAERDGLHRLARSRDAFAGARRVACHRDYTPHNWLFDGATLHILDFEHARLDVPEIDLVKLRAEVWTDAPELEAAFLAGHGPLDADARARLDVLLALHALSTLAWAERHQDPQFAARGRQALAAALAVA